MPERFRLEAVTEGRNNAREPLRQFTADVNEANRAVNQLAQNRTVLVRLEVQGADEVSKLEQRLNSIRDETVTVEVDVDRNGTGTRQLASINENITKMSGSTTGLNARLKDTAAWMGVLAAPGIVTGIAAIPPVLSAVGVAAVAAAEGLGSAAIGAGTFGAAIAAEAVSLRAYTAGISSLVSASRDAYEATHANRIAQLEKERQDILNTQASEAWNVELDENITRLYELGAAVGNRVFPLFTEELDSWDETFGQMEPKIVQTADGIAQVGVNFAEFIRTADDGRLLRDYFDFFNESALRGADATATLGRTLLTAFRPALPVLSDLQDEMQGFLDGLEDAVGSPAFQQGLPRFLRATTSDFKFLVGIGVDFAQGLFHIGQAVDRSGLGGRLAVGIHDAAQEFDELTASGGDWFDAVEDFSRKSGPLLEEIGRTALDISREFFEVSDALIDFRTEGHRLTVLEEIFDAIGDAMEPIGNLLEETFKGIGPEVPELIRNLAEVAEVFAGTTPALQRFLQFINRILDIFNALPDPLKDAIANLIAFQGVLKLLTGGGIGSLAATSTGIAATVTQLGLLRSIARSSDDSVGRAGLLGSLLRLGPVVAVGGVLVVGMAALGVALFNAFKNSKDARDSAQDLWDTLKDLGKQIDITFGDFAEKLGKEWGPAIADGLDAINEQIRDVFDMTSGEPGSTRGRQQLNAERLGLTPPEGADFTSPWQEAGEAMGKALVSGITAALGLGGRGGRGGRGPLYTLGGGAASSFAEGFFDGIGKSFSSDSIRKRLGEAIGDAVRGKGFLGFISGPLGRIVPEALFGDLRPTEIAKELGNVLDKVNWKSAAQSIKEGFMRVLDPLDIIGKLDKLPSQIDKILDKIPGIGKKAFTKFVNFILGPLDELWEELFGHSYISDLPKEIDKWLSKLPGIAKKGFTNFVKAALGPLPGWIKDMQKRWDEADGNFWKFITELAKDATKGFTTFVANIIKKLADWIKQAGQKYTEYKNKFDTFLKDLISRIGQWGIVKAFTNKFEDVTDATDAWIDNMLDKLADFLESIGIGEGSSTRGNTGKDVSGQKTQGKNRPGAYDGGIYNSGTVRMMAEGGMVDATGIYTALTTGMSAALSQGSIWQAAVGGISDGLRPRVVYGEGRPGSGPQQEAYIPRDMDRNRARTVLAHAADWHGMQVVPKGARISAHDAGGAHAAPNTLQERFFLRNPGAKWPQLPGGSMAEGGITGGGPPQQGWSLIGGDQVISFTAAGDALAQAFMRGVGMWHGSGLSAHPGGGDVKIGFGDTALSARTSSNHMMVVDSTLASSPLLTKILAHEAGHVAGLGHGGGGIMEPTVTPASHVLPSDVDAMIAAIGGTAAGGDPAKTPRQRGGRGGDGSSQRIMQTQRGGGTQSQGGGGGLGGNKGWLRALSGMFGGWRHADARVAHMQSGGIYPVNSGNVYPDTWGLANYISGNWEYQNEPGTTYAGHGADGDPMNSVDFLVAPSWGTVATGGYEQVGNEIVSYLSGPKKAMIDYLIWMGQANYGGGWEPYVGGGGYPAPTTVSGHHQDHVHMEVLKAGESGGLTGGGTTGFDAGAAISGFLGGLPRPDYSMMGSYGSKLEDAAYSNVSDALGDILHGILDTVGLTSPSGTAKSGGNLAEWAKFGLEYGKAFEASQGNIDKMVTLGMKESGGELHAHNPSGASGPWQLMPETFAAYRVAATDDIYNGTHNAAASSRYQKDRYGNLVTFSPYTAGGIAMEPHLASVAEAGPEFFMPLDQPESAYRFLNFMSQVYSEQSRKRTPGESGMPGGFDSPEQARAYAAHQAGAQPDPNAKLLASEIAALRRENAELVEQQMAQQDALIAAMRQVGIDEESIEEFASKTKGANDWNTAKDPATRRANEEREHRSRLNDSLYAPRRKP